MTQKEAIEILKGGDNVFLTGQPGAGKTYTINQYIEFLNNKGIYPAVTASTGIAATHIGGVTIHSWSGIGIEENMTDLQVEETALNWWIEKRIRFTKVLIIDEVSMLSAHVLALVDRVCKAVHHNDKPFGGIQVILVGDFFQLPPVTKNNKPVMFAFKSAVWEDLNLKICVLTEQHRQEDDKFLELLTAMRNGKLTLKHKKWLKFRMGIPNEGNITRLFTHNIDVDLLNQKHLKILETPMHTYKMREFGNPKVCYTLKKNCLSPETLQLKEGALVMFTRNNMDEGYVNGTLGKVIEIDKDEDIKVELNTGHIITPKRESWCIKEAGVEIARIEQIPLRLAWAMTVHKSQGMSLDSAIIDLGKAFEFGQGYVALSRVRSFKGLFLDGLNEQALMMHPEIIKKDKEFTKLSLKN